jgi:peptide/nickel transport system substrate-binding protein
MTGASPPGSLTVVQPHVRVGDPHVCSDDRSRLSVLRSVYEPLVRRAGAGAHVPALASAWSVSDDARGWRFRLRDGVRFHDGARFVADDVVASLRRIRDTPPPGELGTTGVYAGYLEGSEIAAEGDLDLRIDLPAPMADLLDVLAELAVLPAERVHDSGRQPPGTGPFRFAGHGEERIDLERWADHWGGPSPVTRVRFEAEPDAAERLERARSGRADVAADVPPHGLEADPAARATLRTQPGSTTTTFMANLAAGALTDRRIRRALNHAVDVEALIADLHGGHADRVADPCTIPQLGHDPAARPYPHDPERARALLAEAGAEGLRLRFDVPERLPDEAPELAARLSEQFAAVGVELESVLHVDRPAYAERVRDGLIHDAACFDSSPSSTFRLFREKFHGGVRGLWWLGYENRAFDELVDRAAATPAIAERRTLYRSAARLLHDDAPWLYLYAPRLAWAVAPTMRAWNPGADGCVDLSARSFAAAPGTGGVA